MRMSAQRLGVAPIRAAVAFHALTLLVFMQEQRDFDDRYSTEAVA